MRHYRDSHVIDIMTFVISYYQSGQRTLTFYLRKGFPKLTDEGRVDIDDYWQAMLLKSPTGLFNGEIYSCNTFEDNGQTLSIGVNKVDYKTYKWARDHKLPLRGAYGIGNGMLLFDPKRNAFTLLKRSETVAFDKAKISVIGGVLSYKQVGVSNFERHIKEATIEEVFEEVQIKGNLEKVALLGLYWDTETYKVEFLYSGQAQVISVKADENKEIVEVPQNEFTNFVQQHRSQMELTSGIHFDHLAAKTASAQI